MAAIIPENLTIFSFLAIHRRLLRTTNGVERLHREVRRRARVVCIFPNLAPCLDWFPLCLTRSVMSV